MEQQASRMLEESVSLFGIIGELDKTKTLFTLLILIVTLSVFDTCLDMVEYFAEDAGYSGLLQKMYKEIMLMGCISFFVFMIYNSPLPAEHNENYLAFEFAHIVLFFLAVFFVLRACLAVHYTRRAKTYFQRAHNNSAVELCEKLIEVEANPFSLKSFTYNYCGLVSNLQRTFEYRVLENFFFKEFPLMPEEFRFVDYMSKSFKFYTIDMVEIEPHSWIVLVLLVLVNYARLHGIGAAYSHDLCYDYHHENDKYPSDDHAVGGRYLAGSEDEKVIRTCPDYLMWYAIFDGFVLVLATMVVCVITHIQKKRLLSLAGVKSAEDQVIKLRELQEAELEDDHQFDQLSHELHSRIKSRTSVWKRVQQSVAKKSKHAVPTKDNSRPQSFRRQSSIMVEKKHETLRLHANHGFDEGDRYYVSTLVVALGAVQRKHLRHHQEFAHRVLFWFKSLSTCFIWNCFSFRSRPEKPRINEKLLESARNLRRSVSLRELNVDEQPANGRVDDAVSQDVSEDRKNEDETLLFHPLLKKIDSIFFFGSRNMYKFFIQLILMLDALYLAIYATNLLPISLDSNRPVLFNVLMVLTILLMSILVSYLLVVSSILFCVTSLNNKGAEWMCEQEEIKRKVLPQLRREMLSFLNNSGDIETFFSLVSGDGDININDFSNFLFTLDIHPSRKEIRALFRAVDADGSGGIDISELKTLLFEPTRSLARHLSKIESTSTVNSRSDEDKDFLVENSTPNGNVVGALSNSEDDIELAQV